jgi:FkbM family methyltransferase
MSRLSRWFRSRRNSPIPATPYEHLLTAPRFQVRTEQLFGEPFQIPDSLSFYCSYREIFLDQLYQFQAACPNPLIVDGGANCGLSVLYFKQLFPAARVIAVEADPYMFSLLEENICRFKLTDVTLINKAIAVGASEVTFHCEGANAGRIHALDDAIEKVSVPVISLDELLAEPVEFLKLDIEGAESDVICSSQRIDVVSQFMIEYHSFADVPQSLPNLLDRLAKSGCRYRLQTQFCPKNPLVDDTCHLGMDFQLNIFANRASQRPAVDCGSRTHADDQQVKRSTLAA